MRPGKMVLSSAAAERASLGGLAGRGPPIPAASAAVHDCDWRAPPRPYRGAHWVHAARNDAVPLASVLMPTLAGSHAAVPLPTPSLSIGPEP